MTTPREKPILMSAPMVRAILSEAKTQTRRVMKPQPEPFGTGVLRPLITACKYGYIGDRLWVRETFMPVEHDSQPYRYRATNPSYVGKWRPSIFMPRRASRITLEITGVRVERLQEISEGDAIAEGWVPAQNDPPGNGGPFDWYRALWESINGGGSWKLNPWVWVIEFKKI